jgi:hypothetical protein
VGPNHGMIRKPRRLGGRHLLSYNRNGIELQTYAAIPACLLISLWTGRKPTLRTFEMLCWYFTGMASEEELLARIARLQKTGGGRPDRLPAGRAVPVAAALRVPHEPAPFSHVYDKCALLSTLGRSLQIMYRTGLGHTQYSPVFRGLSYLTPFGCFPVDLPFPRVHNHFDGCSIKIPIRSGDWSAPAKCTSRSRCSMGPNSFRLK